MEYLPEGRLLHQAQNLHWVSGIDTLADAMQRRQIIEAAVQRCDHEKNLHIQLGEFFGVIPRSETALGLSEGKVREISVLSRVGKPVSFRVVGLQANDGTLTPVLSRRAAQLDARNWIQSLPVGTVIPATVTHMERFGAFVDIGCGLISMIPIDRISVSRIRHPKYRFYPGQEIFAVYRGIDPVTGHILLSHRELLGTWQENATYFSPGETVTGIVRGIQNYGVFVELAPNLTGLAEKCDGVTENQRVSVYIKSIQPERKKIKLMVIGALEPDTEYIPFHYKTTRGNCAGWDYFSDLTDSQ